VDSGSGNLIYWTLPVITTIIHFITHKPRTCLLVRYHFTSYISCLSVSLLSVSVSPFFLFFLTYSICVCICLLSYSCESQSQSQSFVTTDGQSASLSWNKAPMWGLRPDLYYCQIVSGLWMWGALSDERTGLSFARVTVSSNKSVFSMQIMPMKCSGYFAS
jgi:hypothetical protein